MRNEPCGRDIVIPYILYFILNFRMKRFRFCLVAGMLLFISVSTVAKGVPTSIQAAFEKSTRMLQMPNGNRWQDVT